MSLNITRFEGVVSIAKENYKFSCNGTGLVFSVDHTEAMVILNYFSDAPGTSIETLVASPTVTVTTPLEVAGVTVTDLVIPEPAPIPKKRGRPRKQKVLEIEAVAEATSEAVAEASSEAVAEAASEAVAEAASEAVAEEQIDPPDEIKNARQLKGIVSYFVDLGINAAPAIAVECEKYRKSVPLLSRATKLEERIERILVLIGVANDD